MNMPVKPTNVVSAFRESFEETTLGQRWVVTNDTGDIIRLDGNAMGASYVVISKDPWSAGTESSIESIARFKPPLEVSVGLHMSQRTLGQEMFFEVVDAAEPLPALADIEISSISQTATTLTITAVGAHPLRPGMRIGIRDVSDSRLNYTALTVSAVNDLTIYATGGPGGTIPSVTAGPLTGGYIYHRPAMGRANNGVSQVFESVTATNSSIYVRTNSGDILSSGSATGSHSVNVATTASTQLIATAGTYNFQPTSEFRLRFTPEEVYWMDGGIDGSGTPLTHRQRRNQVVPDPDVTYKLRFRAVNNKSLSRPIAGILSVTKTGTTIATVVCDRPHGLSLTSYISSLGPRDTVNFPTLGVSALLTIVDATTFTVNWGTAATASSYGGTINLYVAPQAAQGFSAVSVQSAKVTGGVLQLTGSANWSGFLIGDYVNAAGLIGASGSLGLDGVYCVKDYSGGNVYLVPIGNTPVPADMITANCGGSVIRRTDLRLSWVRVVSHERQRVEFTQKAVGDGYASLMTYSTGGYLTLGTGSSVIGYAGFIPPFVNGTADVVSGAITTNTTTSPITPGGGCSYVATVAVTAISGTNPTLDIDVEESEDNGTNWIKVYSFPRISSTGMFRSPKLPMSGSRVRYVQTLGGTSPSFTRVINRLMSNDIAPALRQLISRTITMTSLDSVTPSLDVRNCRNVQLLVLTISATSNTVLQMEGSDDNGISWWPIGTTLTAVPNSAIPSVLTVNNIHTGLIRARVSTAGTSVVYSHVLIKGF